MKDIDPIAFGRRVRERRSDLEWGQQRLADESRYSQTNIGWVEQGKAKDPRKQALRLAEALNTTPEWLLHGTGQKEVGPPTLEQLTKACDDLPADAQLEIREALAALIARHAPKKKRA